MMASSFSSVVEKVAPSVVSVHTSKTVKLPRALRDFFGGQPNGGTTQGLGSGVIVSPDGYILTNNHVTDGADEIYVTFGADRKQFAAQKVGADPGTDLAVLKIEAENLPVIPFANIKDVKVGDIVLAVGNPFGLTQTVTMGIISGLGRGGMGIVDYENFIQTDASVNPGNSGGALVDAQGRLVGINTAIFSKTGGNQGIGFAVPVDLAAQVFESIRENGRVIRGYLGTVVQPVTKEVAEVFGVPEPIGALVADITPNSPAERSGLKPGDIILSVDGTKITSPRDLRLLIGTLKPGSKVTIDFIRDGEQKSLEVELAELGADEARLVEQGKQDEGEEPATFLNALRLTDLTDEIRAMIQAPENLQGVVILDVNPDAPVYRAGLRQGFVITEINRKPVRSAKDVAEVAKGLKKGAPVLMRVWSGGQNQYLAIPTK